MEGYANDCCFGMVKIGLSFEPIFKFFGSFEIASFQLYLMACFRKILCFSYAQDSFWTGSNQNAFHENSLNKGCFKQGFFIFLCKHYENLFILKHFVLLENDNQLTVQNLLFYCCSYPCFHNTVDSFMANRPQSH